MSFKFISKDWTELHRFKIRTLNEVKRLLQVLSILVDILHTVSPGQNVLGILGAAGLFNKAELPVEQGGQ